MRFSDISGQTFGRLKVLRVASKKHGKYLWECLCDCGNKLVVYGSSLRKGTTKSCGCLQRETVINRNLKHGKHGVPEYRVWKRIIQRCENASDHNYPRYGARGITVCHEWRTSFPQFLKDMGQRPFPDAQIDRIDNNGNYEPGNCRWADRITQANNTRNNRRINVDGVSRTIAEWARFTGIPYDAIRSRLNSGWSNKISVTAKLKHMTHPITVRQRWKRKTYEQFPDRH